MKLTPATARELPAGGRLRDHEVKGLELRAGKTRKTWLLYYRAAGLERRPALGTFPELSVSAARDAAKALLLAVAKGEDPSATRQLARGEPTVADLCDWYLERWAPHRKGPAALLDDRRMIDAYIRRAMGSVRLASVTTAQLEALLDDVLHRRFVDAGRRRRDGKATAPGRAASVRTLLRHLLGRAAKRYLKEQGRSWATTFPEGNPVDDTAARRVHSRRRVAQPEELRNLIGELRRLEADKPRHAAGIWALFLCGARVGEVINMTADQRHGDKLILRDHKTAAAIGEKVIPLPSPVIELLDRLGPENSGRYFPAYKTIVRAWWALRKAAGCPDLQLKDARRTFASYALEGATLDQIGQLYGHTDTKTTRGYSWMLEDKKRAVAEAGAAAIIKAGNANGD